MVTDDLNTYKPAVERLGLEHQICIAHVRKWARKRLDGIDGWDWVKARIWRLLTDLPPDGGLELLRLERAVRDGDAALRRLCVELSGKWRALLCHRRRRDVPRTNNVTERAIGRSKIRYKTVRGYKSEDGMLNGFGLTQWAWSGRDGLDVSELVAGVTPRRFLGDPRPPKPAPKCPTVSGTVTRDRAIASYCASRSIVRRYSKSQPALFRFAAHADFQRLLTFHQIQRQTPKRRHVLRPRVRP